VCLSKYFDFSNHSVIAQLPAARYDQFGRPFTFSSALPAACNLSKIPVMSPGGVPSTYFDLSGHSVMVQLPAARLPARRTFHRPTVPAIPLRVGAAEKESPIFPGSYVQNEINKNKRLGSLFLNFLSLHHSAREERLLREKKP